MKLSKEEKELLDSVEAGEWKRIPDFKKEAAHYREAARASDSAGCGPGCTEGNRHSSKPSKRDEGI